MNDALADVLAERLDARRPAVVLNCPPRWVPGPTRERRFHALLGLDAAARIVLYHGGLEPGRGIEELLAMPRLPGDTHLVLMGYGPLRDDLAGRLASDPELAARVHLVPPVAPADLLPWVASADVAAMPIVPTTQNNRLSTPNKLFEAIAAGVPVVTTDLPVRRRIVMDDPAGPLGVFCDPTEPASIAAAIRSLLDLPPAAMADLRSRCLRAAHERYCWETQLETILEAYGELTGRPW